MLNFYRAYNDHSLNFSAEHLQTDKTVRMCAAQAVVHAATDAACDYVQAIQKKRQEAAAFCEFEKTHPHIELGYN